MTRALTLAGVCFAMCGLSIGMTMWQASNGSTGWFAFDMVCAVAFGGLFGFWIARGLSYRVSP